MFTKQKRYREASNAYRRVLEINEGVFGPNSRQTAESILDYARSIEEKHGPIPNPRMKEATPHLERYLQLVTNLWGAESAKAASAFITLGRNYSAVGNSRKGLDLIRRGYTIRRNIFGETHEETLAAAETLAIRLMGFNSGKPEATKIMENVLQATEQRFGRDSLEAAKAAASLIVCYFQEKKYLQMETVSRRALSIHTSRGKEVTIDTLFPLLGVTLTHSVKGDYRNADLGWERIFRFMETSHLSNSAIMARFLTVHAENLQKNAKPQRAEKLIKKSILLFHKISAGAKALANAYNILGETYAQQSKYHEAEPAFRRALSYGRQISEPTRTSRALNGLGVAALNLKRPAEARTLLLEAMSAIRNTTPRKSHFRGALLNNLGEAHRKLGEFRLAEKYYKLSLEQYRSGQTAGPPRDATTEFKRGISLNNLGLLYYRQGKYEAARRLYKAALEIPEKYNARKGRLSISTRANLALAEYKLNNISAAFQLMKDVKEALHKRLTSPEYADIAISEEQRDSYNLNLGFFVELALHSDQRGDLSETSNQAFEALQLSNHTSVCQS